MHLAIIPARSGSKGLKDKNVKRLSGKHMIGYTIEAALQSTIFDEVHVSTDSESYAKIAISYGAKVPFLRPDNLGTDATTTMDVVKYVLETYEDNGVDFDVITILQPTSPLRTYLDIREAYHMFVEKKAESIVSVCEVEHSPLWANTLKSDNSLYNFISKDVQNTPRQLLETYYRLNGAIYMMMTKLVSQNHSLYGEQSFAFVMDRDNSIDVDTEIDFKIAELLMTEKK